MSPLETHTAVVTNACMLQLTLLYSLRRLVIIYTHVFNLFQLLNWPETMKSLIIRVDWNSDRRDYGKEYFNLQPENRPAYIVQVFCLSHFFFHRTMGHIDTGIAFKNKYWEQSRSWRECGKALLKEQTKINIWDVLCSEGPWQCICFALRTSYVCWRNGFIG